MQKGQHFSKKVREKMRVSALKRDDINRIASLPKGINHWNWKTNPNLLTLHKRIHRKFGKASLKECIDCNKKARDWSLIKGHEYTDNVLDYEPRCRSCHIKYDEPLRGYKHSLKARKNMSLAHLSKAYKKRITANRKRKQLKEKSNP